MDPASILFAGISALMSTISVWQTERDRRRAREVFESQFAEQIDASRTQRAARWLHTVAPDDVIDRLKSRAEKCWDRYRDILDKPDEYLPDEVDEATRAVKKCICRELRRIYELEGEVPEEWQDQWDKYECAVGGS